MLSWGKTMSLIPFSLDFNHTTCYKVAFHTVDLKILINRLENWVGPCRELA